MHGEGSHAPSDFRAGTHARPSIFVMTGRVLNVSAIGCEMEVSREASCLTSFEFAEGALAKPVEPSPRILSGSAWILAH